MSLIQDLLPHMRRVSAADRELHDLSLIWTLIESTSAISCPEEAEAILPTLSQTRQAFGALHGRLVERLGQEHLAELRDELVSTAQCTADILVRNLYERTADVGFLATDDVLRQFCAARGDDRLGLRAGLQRRLAEYRDKYTVYDDIVILSASGEVLARLDDQALLQRSADPLVAQAVGRTGYVQQFAVTDLASDGLPALLYGHRIVGDHGRCEGVLVLRFQMADEMQRVFASVCLTDRNLAVVLVNAQGQVMVSNDENHIPVGVRLKQAGEQDVQVIAFAGREYLSVTCPTRGYQGYQGLGWRAQALVSLLTAFHQRHAGAAVQAGVSLDNADLRRIQADVDSINRNLRRVVWNGRLSASTLQGNPLRLKAVLQQVNSAGERMRDRVGLAIQDLYRASLGRALQQTADLARLAADIMDRNLYERANDCRWWALSPVLQQALAEPDAPGVAARINAVLSHVNSLYTVYSRLVVFDVQGLVRGVSNDDPNDSLLGTRMQPEQVAATLELPDSQRYAVSPFGPFAISGGEPTYVYLAAVRCPQGGRALGGIAIVFNAQVEFRAMLEEVLGGRPGLAAFVDRDGRIVASTDPAQAPGQPFPLDLSQSIIEHDGAHWALSRVKAGGYREFNGADGYRHGLSAVLALRLGALERRRVALVDRGLRAERGGGRGASQELAVFHVGAGRYALPTLAVLGAFEPNGVVRMPAGAAPVIGLLDVGTASRPVVIPVICARQLFGVRYPARQGDGTVIVLQDPRQRGRVLCGMRVDEVICVVDAVPSSIQPLPDGLVCSAPFLSGVVRLEADGPERQSVLVQLLSPEVLAQLAPNAPEAAMEAEELLQP